MAFSYSEQDARKETEKGVLSVLTDRAEAVKSPIDPLGFHDIMHIVDAHVRKLEFIRNRKDSHSG